VRVEDGAFKGGTSRDGAKGVTNRQKKVSSAVQLKEKRSGLNGWGQVELKGGEKL